jgi:hypothetical protein
MTRRAWLQAGTRTGAWWQLLGVVAALPWLATRLGWLGSGDPFKLGLTVGGRLWPFLYVDHSVSWLVLPAVV